MKKEEKNSLTLKKKILEFLFYFFSALTILEVIFIFISVLLFKEIDQNSLLENILVRWPIRLLLPSALLALIFGDLSSD